MSRPTKWRRVETVPAVVYFKPAENLSLRLLSETVLAVEEVEAIRLRTWKGWSRRTAPRG